MGPKSVYPLQDDLSVIMEIPGDEGMKRSFKTRTLLGFFWKWKQIILGLV